MRDCGAVLFVLAVLTLGFDRVAGLPYGSTARFIAHTVGAFLRGV